MKIQYESAIEDYVELQTRYLTKLNIVRKGKMQIFYIAPFFSLFFYFIGDGRDALKGIIALSIGIFMIVFHLLIYDPWLKRRLRRLGIKERGSEHPIGCECECTEEAMVFKVQGLDIHFKWESIKEIEDNDNDFTIWGEHTGLAILRNEYFESMEERYTWLAFVKEKTGL